MAVLRVRKYGDPALRRRASEVGEITPEIRKLVDDMVETMYDEVGIGLAAPQVGVSLRLIVIADDASRQVRALVNPVIVDLDGERTAEEGCLSIPGIFAPVSRAVRVRVEARDLDGAPVMLEGRELLARVFQHEIDHLDGVLFIDRLDPMTRDRIKRKIKKEGLAEGSRHNAFAL
ncbi:MAG TPA: peptide deformylase [Methylomirabilota bacterium]|nr:peptide deformylase [Methylomirabilota bacterium]